MNAARRALALTIFSVAVGTNVATPLFLIYEVELGLSAWVVTALFAIYPIGLAPALIVAGPASDAYGRRVVTLPGLLLSGLASTVMIFGDDVLALLFLGRFLLGAVSGLVFVVASAWMQELGEPNPLGNARLMSTLLYAGFGLGPLASGVLGQWGPAPLTLPYLVHLALVMVALATFAVIPETVHHPFGRRPSVRPNLGVPDGATAEFWRVLIPGALGVFVFPSLAFGLFPVLLRPVMEEIAVFVTGLIFVIAMWVTLPVQTWVGRIGPYRAAPLGLLFGTVGSTLGLLAFASDWWPLLFPAGILLGACSGLSMTSGLRLVEHLTSPQQRGALTGAFYAAAYAGMTAPLATSTLAKATGFEVALAIVTFAAALLTAWMYHATAGRSLPDS